MSRVSNRLALLFVSLISPQAFAQEGADNVYAGVQTQLAQPLTDNELSPFDITVHPNGKNLPTGMGSVGQGKALYEIQCQMCHGEKGIEGPAARLVGSDGWASWSDPLRILRIDKYPVLLISVGGLWPHATSVFDYIRRAMPHYAPKSLSNDQSYSLTAYILYMNDLLGEEATLDTTLDKKSIMQVQMSAQPRSVLAWPEQAVIKQ